MFKRNIFLLLALITVIFNSQASIEHDVEHHYHDEHVGHDEHAGEDADNLNTSNCEECLLEHSITESSHIHEYVPFTFLPNRIFNSSLFGKSFLSPVFLVYQARAP